jgi:DNA (cytosine-5)-methyltransferase 1
MKHGSLFSGIGGFDLAAEWMGWENVFHCEWMEFPRKVLDYHFPNADSHIDICKTDFKKYANTIDILTGGFPCQPFSLAGKRKGTDDERYLWGEMLRAIQEIKPKYVIAENVFGITNIDGGLVFQQVCLDLENEGYEVQPFIIPAAAKNAPHRRDRCWFIAYTNCNDGRSTDRESRCEESKTNGEGEQPIHSRIGTTSNEGIAADTKSNGSSIGKLGESQTKQQVQTGSDIDGFESLGNATNTNGNGFNERNGNDEINTSERGEYAFNDIEQIPIDTKCIGRTEIRYDNGQFKTPQQSERREQQFSGADSTQSGWRNFPSQPPVCSGDDGIPRELDGITFPKWRAESIKGYGNAIVPQIAYQLFEIIQELNENN